MGAVFGDEGFAVARVHVVRLEADHRAELAGGDEAQMLPAGVQHGIAKAARGAAGGQPGVQGGVGLHAHAPPAEAGLQQIRCC
jgi:hypothetical protein